MKTLNPLIITNLSPRGPGCIFFRVLFSKICAAGDPMLSLLKEVVEILGNDFDIAMVPINLDKTAGGELYQFLKSIGASVNNIIIGQEIDESAEECNEHVTMIEQGNDGVAQSKTGKFTLERVRFEHVACENDVPAAQPSCGSSDGVDIDSMWRLATTGDDGELFQLLETDENVSSYRNSAGLSLGDIAVLSLSSCCGGRYGSLAMDREQVSILRNDVFKACGGEEKSRTFFGWCSSGPASMVRNLLTNKIFGYTIKIASKCYDLFQ